MINPIIEGIAAALDSKFGKGYAIYTESVEQGLDEPCFFISMISSGSQMTVGSNRQHSENAMCVQYFPKDEQHGNEECFGVMDRLTECLKWIHIDGDLVMGRKMNGEIIDGILSFFVNYDFNTYTPKELIKMQDIKCEPHAKR